MSPAAFKRNEFRPYRAINKIHLGKYEVDIMLDDEFDYDGSTVRYAGTEYAVPQLKGLLGDWFVPVQDQTTTYVSKPAGVQVSHATPEARERGDSFTMDEASEEEAVVATMGEQKQIREAAASGDTDRLAELRATRAQRKADIGIGGVESNPDAPPPENAADVDPEVEAALMEHTEQTFIQAKPVHSSGQQGKVAPGDQAAVARANAINQQRIAARTEELAEADPYKSKTEMGGERHDSSSAGGRKVGKGGKFTVVEQDDGEVVGKYNFSDGAAVGSEGVAGDMEGTNVMKVGQKRPVQVGKAVATTPHRDSGAQAIDDPATLHKPQGASARGTTQVQAEGNVGIDEMLPGGGTGDVDEAMVGDDLASLMPDAAVAGVVARKKAPAMSEADEIAEVAFGWNTRRNWQKRVQEACDFYGDWPEALDAICAKESPKVAEQIRSKLARAETVTDKG